MMTEYSENNFEQCIKCTVCTVYCPAAAANPLFPGPKQAGPDGERLRLKQPGFYDEALKYCLNCKRCEVACPSNVRIGDIIQLALSHELADIQLTSEDYRWMAGEVRKNETKRNARKEA